MHFARDANLAGASSHLDVKRLEDCGEEVVRLDLGVLGKVGLEVREVGPLLHEPGMGRGGVGHRAGREQDRELLLVVVRLNNPFVLDLCARECLLELGNPAFKCLPNRELQWMVEDPDRPRGCCLDRCNRRRDRWLDCGCSSWCSGCRCLGCCGSRRCCRCLTAPACDSGNPHQSCPQEPAACVSHRTFLLPVPHFRAPHPEADAPIYSRSFPSTMRRSQGRSRWNKL